MPQLDTRTGMTRLEFERRMLENFYEEMDFYYVDKVTDVGIKCHYEGAQKGMIILDEVLVNDAVFTDSGENREEVQQWEAVNYLSKFIGLKFKKSDFHAYTDYALISKDFNTLKNVITAKEYLTKYKQPKKRD